jgi:hypothetical protein
MCEKDLYCVILNILLAYGASIIQSLQLIQRRLGAEKFSHVCIVSFFSAMSARYDPYFLRVSQSDNPFVVQPCLSQGASLAVSEERRESWFVNPLFMRSYKGEASLCFTLYVHFVFEGDNCC